MFKYIIMTVIIALFTACSAPKPKHAPSWYTSKPKDFKNFYAVGSGKSITNAKNRAILNMRKELIEKLNSAFENKTNKIQVGDENILHDILKENEKLINTMAFSNLTIEKTQTYNNNQLILLKLPRKSVFKKLETIANKRFMESRELYAQINESAHPIQKYSILSKNMQHFAKLASITQAKEITLSTNTFKDVAYLNKISEEFFALKNQISIYLLPDINSQIYLKSLKDALISTGLEVSSKPKSDKSLRLFITSDTENILEYGFNRSKTLVKYTTYDLNKNKVAFRQHTFSAKSRKSYSDAKAQTAMHQKSKINKLGVFDFIGVK